MNALQLELPPELVTDLKLIKSQLQDLKENYQPKEPNVYMTRQEVSEMLSINLSTLWNWQNKKIVQPLQIGGKVLFLRSSIESKIVELKN